MHSHPCKFLFPTLFFSFTVWATSRYACALSPTGTEAAAAEPADADGRQQRCGIEHRTQTHTGHQNSGHHLCLVSTATVVYTL